MLSQLQLGEFIYEQPAVGEVEYGALIPPFGPSNFEPFADSFLDFRRTVRFVKSAEPA